jgi:hypothetical protein
MDLTLASFCQSSGRVWSRPLTCWLLTCWLAICLLPITKPSLGDDGLQYFETHIRPVLVEHCYECHSADANKSQGELLLDSRQAMRAGGASGPAVVPGDASNSLILDALRHESFEMPPSGKLDDAVIAKFEQWILNGAEDPRESAEPVAGRVTGLAKVNWDTARDHWSFRPMQQAAAPELHSDRPRGAIDAFIWSKLQEVELEPTAEATRTAWLRRVNLDLIGLPPSPQELQSFLADSGPDAFERVVDRLLASPRYGERYGRHWLDLARYADSNGADENHGYPVAWRYRDYVVDAYNTDLPYDRFVLEQLAGDLLPADSEAERGRLLTATGMIVIGPKMLAEQDKPKLVADLVDEQVDTVGKVFLGLTLGCARCHDHKFDPIKAEDYYALAGIFHSTKSMEHLEFVSQWNERELPNAARSQQVADHQKRLEQTKFELKQLEIDLHQSLFDKQLQALAARIGWRAGEHNPSGDELAALGLAEPQAQRLAEFVDRQTWRDAKALATLGEDLRALVKQPAEAATPSQLQAAIVDAIRAARLELQSGERDDKGQLKDERLAKLESQIYGKNGPFVAIEKLEEAVTAEEKDRLLGMRETLATLEKSKPALDKAMAADEGPLKLVSVHVRGNHLQMVGDPVKRRVPEILQPTTPEIAFPENQSGRMEFATWMTAPAHPLTARVMVNRLWQYHFGEGLVRSASNFGLSGDSPTHPELLDFLATEFVEHGWSQKAMHRKIVLSSAYRLSSSGNDHGNLVDPDNRLLWRMNRRRLEVEPLRDSLLAVADELDAQTGGQAQAIYGDKFEDTQEAKTIHDASRRTLYLPINRAALEEFFATFDYVDSAVSLEKRPVTTVPHQALFLMNHRLALHAGWRLAKRLEQHSSDDTERLKFAYAVCFAREPTTAELSTADAFLLQQRAPLASAATAPGATAPSETAPEKTAPTRNAPGVGQALEPWVKLCRSLLLTNEFLYVE